jgi:hypothetical protein
LTTGVEDVHQYGFPREIPAAVEISAGGKTYKTEQKRVKGDPWWPETMFADRDLYNKLASCVRGGLPEKSVADLFDLIMNIEREPDVSRLGDYFRMHDSRGKGNAG